ncbi:DUF2213 domain-containing protein [Brucella pseudogrignonensis]|uniref:DUF2213 domain-containing protein n=1 Tax=Brucella pseudogrignonensis TaxID=419475 RepID=UPI000CFA9619|nr:DUF2213 domain-containing protein [Brucella pseudogrignonensis]MQP40940.1 DUF2213 domain-containing protein [Ochrobactrum sp. MYb237]PQZ40894.1 hypothetical protein CQ059_16720 [Brucella pseudogrignonensis]PRA40387.1 hypothetical protein CQ063_12435 [Brucella pseudogrignonensis]PRA68980.1 hypothetical protein CQ055_12320 [Brucella pseudogrignonensis]
MVRFNDRATVSDYQEQPDGRLTVYARVARGGNVQVYGGYELGRSDMSTVRVYRPEDAVFDPNSASTFAHKYVTLGHPAGQAVFDKDAVGWIGDEIMREGDAIRVPMVIAHKRALDAIKSDVRELSVGYSSELEWGAGVTPAGERYDAKMTNIIVDHVAIVETARGGPSLRLGDSNTMSNLNDKQAEAYQRSVNGLNDWREKEGAASRTSHTTADAQTNRDAYERSVNDLNAWRNR